MRAQLEQLAAEGVEYVYFLRPFYSEEIPDLVYEDMYHSVHGYTICRVPTVLIYQWLDKHGMM